MARSTRILWGKWDCSNCSTKGISAEPPAGETQPRCPTCGSPREQNAGERAYLDNARADNGRVLNANVADTAEEVAIATAGADWPCGRCGGDNRAANTSCEGCGASRAEADRGRSAAEGLAAPPVAKARLPAGFALGALFLVVALPCGGWIAFDVYKGFYTEELPGTITALRWQHTVNLETYAPALSGGWRAQLTEAAAVMPVNGAGESGGVIAIRDCGMRHHHDEQYECGTERVCEQKSRTVTDGETCHEVCNTVDNGNGSFTESCDDVCSSSSHTEHYEDCHEQTKFCSRPIEAEWCTYDTWSWAPAGEVELHGESPAAGTTALPWPDGLGAAELQRTVRRAHYQVEYSVPEPEGVKVTSESAYDEADFLSLRLGQPVRATVGWDGEVKNVHR